MTSKRFWRLDRALLGILRKGRCSGKCMQKIIGNLTWGMLLNRPLLSVFCAVYAFSNSERIRQLWGSVRRELSLIRGLLPFCRRDLRTKAAGVVYASDACGSGFAVGRADVDLQEVHKLCRVDERWRFRDDAKRGSARSEALASEELEGPEVWEKGFRPLPFSVMRDSSWRHMFFSAFSDQRPIHLKEAHSSIASLKHSLRCRHSFNRHHLLLSDNMSVCLALGKGRCADARLLQYCRRACALQVASCSMGDSMPVPPRRNAAWPT